MKLASSSGASFTGRAASSTKTATLLQYTRSCLGHENKLARYFRTSSYASQRGPSIPANQEYIERKIRHLEFPLPPDPLARGKPLPLLKKLKKIGTTIPPPLEIPKNWVDYEAFPLLHPQYRYTQHRADLDDLKGINRVPGSLIGFGRPTVLLHFPISTLESYINKRRLYAGKYCRVVLPEGNCVLAEVQSMQLHAVSLRPRNLTMQLVLPDPVKWTGSMEPLVLRRYPKGVFKKARAERDRQAAGIRDVEVKQPTEEQMRTMLEVAQKLFPTETFELDMKTPVSPLTKAELTTFKNKQE